MKPKTNKYKSEVDENGRVCTRCNRYKSWDKYPKARMKATPYKNICKSCENKKNREHWKSMSLNDKIKKRSYSIKSNWSARAKKYEKREEVPTRQEIEDWLRSFKEFRCAFSGELIEDLDFQIDHNIPISRGGSFSLDNCLIMTKKSNSIKGSLTLEELFMLQDALKNWPDKGEVIFQRLYQSSSTYKNSRR